jgi:asparagine synthase (glutamine-hydrolysing)
MCGIVGIVDRDLDRPVGPADLQRMVRTLRHRGPDEEGSVTLPGVGLGMRRLSIVDLAGGSQPFASEDGAIRLVANGEIYNHLEVRQQLLAKGHKFTSRSDIEVLVHAYEEYGEDFLKKLRGMFALALWDARTRTLLAARDRAGEKPLYYTLTERGLFLASEIKALLVRAEVSRDLDLEALDQFLTYEYIVAPRTIFAHVKKLPAAHYLVYRNGRVTVHRYWDAADVQVRRWSENEACEALRETLGHAVASQMMSDVPLGVFLSGGIDSSTVVAFMAEASRHECSVNSFSMGFEDGSYNELPYAREVAAHFHTHHRERTVQPDLEVLFDQLIVHLDEPFADVSLFPTFQVSQMAREHVKVVLAGDGGDELFGGYDAYAADRIASLLDRMVPQGALTAIDRVASLLPPSGKKKGLVNKVRRFTEGVASRPREIGHYRWMTYLSGAARDRLYGPELRAALERADVYRPVRECLEKMRGRDPLNRQLYTDLCIYLTDDILVKVDRMSMATSLETRAPFLDADVMELAFSMPGDLKVRGSERKYVLKQAMRGILPPSILARRKEGFSIPMKNWLRRELAPLMERLLTPDRLVRRGLFEPDDVQRRIAAHKAGRENHAHTLFSLMVFERWADQFLEAR